MELGLESIMGQIPLFILILVLPSYLVWSKFLNRGKLGFKKTNDILNLLVIFVLMTLIVFSISFLISGIFRIIQSVFYFNETWQNLISNILIVEVIFTIIVVFSIRNYKNRKKDLLGITQGVNKFIIFIMLIIGGFYLASLFFNFRLKLFGAESFILFYIFLCLIILWFTAMKSFSGFSWNTKTDLRFYGSGLFLGIIFFFLFCPLISYSGSEIIEHEFNGLDLTENLTLKYFNYSISSLGIGGDSVSPILIFDYEKESISLRKRIKVMLIDKEGKVVGEDNFYRDLYDDKPVEREYFSASKNYDGKILFKYNYDKLKLKKIKKIVIKAWSNESISGFSIKDSQRCFDNYCFTTYSIDNNLSSVVYLDDGLKVRHSLSDCEFFTISSTAENEHKVNNDCKNLSCDYEVRKITEEGVADYYINLDMALENRLLGINHFGIHPDIGDFNLTVAIKCPN